MTLHATSLLTDRLIPGHLNFLLLLNYGSSIAREPGQRDAGITRR